MPACVGVNLLSEIMDEVEAETRRAPLAATPSRERRRHPGRQHLPDNLPRVEEIVRCAEQTCRQCGAETAVIDYDESEQLDVEPARIRNHKC